MTPKILAILGLLLITISSYELEGEVLVLTDEDDFPAVLKQNPYILVEFYAPWYQFDDSGVDTVKNQPLFILRQHYNLKKQTLQLAKVDSTKNIAITKLHGVRSYPTLVYYINGAKIPFKGSRTKEGIIEWCTKKLSPAVTELNTESFNKLKQQNNKVSVILLSNDENERKVFEGIALADEHNQYYYGPSQLITGNREILLLRNFASEVKYSGDLSQFSVWLETQGRPKLLPFDSRTIDSIWTGNKKALLFVNPGGDIGAHIHNIVQELANNQKRPILYSELNKSDDMFVKLSTWIKVSFDRPRIIAFENGRKVKFVFPGEINKQSINEFINNFLSGKASQYEIGMQDQYTDPVQQAQAETEL